MTLSRIWALRAPPDRPVSCKIDARGKARPYLYASTDLANVDGRVLRDHAEAEAAQAFSCRFDAGASDALQLGLRGLRQDPIPRPRFEDRSHAGAMLSGGG